MTNASTRAHVASPTAISQIPAARFEDHQISAPQTSDADSTNNRSPPLSRKEKRKQKHDSALPTPSGTDTETQRKPPKKKPRQPNLDQTLTLTPTIPTSPGPMAAKNATQKAYPLLVCSIGNPGNTYANTLHSAGHIITNYIAIRKAYKPFQKAMFGLVSKPDTTKLSFGLIKGFRRVEGGPVDVEEDWTFWQSTSLMNVSGKGVNRAYTEWLRGVRQHYGDSTLEGRLVVVHDELESALGKVTIRDGAASAKGHNGLKSCQASLGKTKWWRVGVGIGRPQSREPDEVSRYVLRKITENERSALENSAVSVANALEEIAAGQK